MRDEAVRTARRLMLNTTHIAALTTFARELKHTHSDRDVPFFDPLDGGTAARILILLEAPGPLATEKKGSEFVSLNNDDPTAATLWRLVHEAGISRADLIVWNIVPWYLGDDAYKRINAATRKDIELARPDLLGLLKLLPALKVAVLLGRPAQTGWLNATPEMERPLPVVASRHPSPRAWAGNAERLAGISEALSAAVRVAESAATAR